jgi:hypothetical protein
VNLDQLSQLLGKTPATLTALLREVGYSRTRGRLRSIEPVDTAFSMLTNVDLNSWVVRSLALECSYPADSDRPPFQNAPLFEDTQPADSPPDSWPEYFDRLSADDRNG